MAKKNSLFECQFCGWQTTKWLGKCPECGSWESLIELNDSQKQILKALTPNAKTNTPTAITEVKSEKNIFFTSYQEEFDVVLGGGIVPGGLYLIGGSPGVGKSTLLLKVAGLLAKHNHNVLYVSGEESAGQICLRAQRLDCIHPKLFLLNEINLDSIKNALLNEPYELCVIDSIQTLYAPSITSAPGSISQVREITFELMRLAKEHNIAIFIIGHITKEGSIAGPKILEHMVECVLYFEGDSSREFRILRGFKNRFGTTSEIGIFEMNANGLNSVKDIQKVFFQKRKPVAGSAITVLLEGSRALVIEIQALVSESYGNARRQSTGFDVNRLNMLRALLERKLEIPLNRYDVFINVAGGIKITEPSADLCVVAAIISSFRNRPLSVESVFIGEVSLTGDVRDVSNLDIRIKEIQNYGLNKAIVPKKPSFKTDVKCFEVGEVSKVLEWM
ncbi:DNA repair protein RadA [uncultured Helicobacter sp.]|uniref:DNA repair protein RadA n=1 Tax=uncultured Helicobacter sp. TaxID=175537 RepID=UPI002599F732|nr:DNA repair protein RadA [uncultured Helicobacter sp.]